MRIESDLSFSVTVPGRTPTTGTVTAEGAHVTVDTTDPVAVWDGALGSPTTGTGVLRVVAEQLAEQGITLTVTGPGGRVASVGAGIDSGLGRLATGSRRVSLGRPGAVAPLARARVVATLRDHRAPVLAALAAALGAGALVALRDRGTRRILGG